MIRFYIKPGDYKNKIIRFDADQSKKIRKVLRLKIGDMIKAFDGKGWEYDGQLVKVTNEYSLAKIVDQKLAENKSNKTILQALPKNLKIEFVVQKCTELGADRIIFFESDFSQVDAKRISKEKVARWRSIAEQATEQCGRIFVPEIELFTGSVQELVDAIKEQTEGVFFLDISGKTIRENEGLLEKENVAVLIGPEGGFSPKEKDIFKKQNVKAIRISDNILRSETAGMVFLAQLY